MNDTKRPIKPRRFVGRKSELKYIQKAANAGEAAILVVYGRRRIGKTELIEHALHDRNLIKLEGVEDGDTQAQQYRVLYQLSKVFNDPHITHMRFHTWLELFDFIASKVSAGVWTLYLEEVQWLAEYTQSKVGTEVIDEFEQKLLQMPHTKGKTIEKVLISASGATDALIARAYFDRVITLEDIFHFLESKLQ